MESLEAEKRELALLADRKGKETDDLKLEIDMIQERLSQSNLEKNQANTELSEARQQVKIRGSRLWVVRDGVVEPICRCFADKLTWIHFPPSLPLAAGPHNLREH
jgi:hypothetical protein